jgi:site-specific recombinase XerD
MKAHTPTLASLLESFFRKRLVAQRRASPETILAYRHALRLLLLFAATRLGSSPSRLTLEHFDTDLVLAFLDDLEAGRGNSIRTRNARLAALRSFFHHVAFSDPALMGVAHRIVSLPGKRTSRQVVSFLTREELDVILTVPDLAAAQGRRDRALLLFLARTGARVTEAISVSAMDLRLDRPSQVLLHGKGSKDRVVPLAPDLATVLRALRDERGVHPDSGEPLFVNARGRRLTRFGVVHIVRRIVAAAVKTCPGLARRSISPHTLRHTTAMHLLQAEVDLTTIQSWLGHASVATTHHYVEADLEMKRRALAQCDFPDAKPARYQPTDELLALLERL